MEWAVVTSWRVGMVLLWALMATTASAGQWQVAPLRVELSGKRPNAALTVLNRANEPAPLHVRAYAWSQVKGEDRLKETDALIVSPPIFTVGGAREQTLRVGLRYPRLAEAASVHEQTYRIVIDEVPDTGPDSTGVRLVLRLSLPVFVRTGESAPRMAWQVVRDPQGRWQLEAANHGNGHAQLLNVRVRAPGEAEPLAEVDQPAYLLPGTVKRWPLTPAAAAIDAAAPLQIEAQTLTGRIDASVVPTR